MVGIVVAFLVLVVFLLPALRDGAPAVPVALVASAAILYAVIYLAHGVSLRTSAALLGTLSSLLLAAGLSWGAIQLTHLTGLADEQNSTVSAYLGNVSISGLLLAGFIIGSLGAVSYTHLCDETQQWQPDIADMESKITERTKALVVINPNNPTGAVYSREVLTQIAELARKHQLLLLADEIYDKILYDDAKHISLATVAPDLLCLTFNGLSKAYRVAGYRAGWLAITGPKDHAGSFIEGISLLANMRLCPNVPAQHAIQVALGGHQSIDDLVLPGGRLLEQRDVAWTKLNEIPGVSCVKPEGALYVFPRLDPEVYDIEDDEQLVLDLLLQEKILVTQGTGFNWPAPDHLRLVTLPWSRDLSAAIDRLGNFLSSYRQ